MSVDGYVTSRELYEVHGMTPALIRKFLPEHDEQAVFEDGGGCVLYSTGRVSAVLKSPKYLVEREKTERRRESGRRSAQKGAAKRAATLARKRELEDKAEADARAAFGGGVYLVRCAYTYGWREYGVYARDTDHARALMDKWLRSEEGRSESTDLHEDAVVSAVARKSVILDGTSTTTCRGCMSEHRRQEPIWTSVRGAGVKAVNPAERGRSEATRLDVGEHTRTLLA